MSKNVKKYVDTCSICHRSKIVRHKSYEYLEFLLHSKDSREDWTINFITDLSLSVRRDSVFDSILMIIDRYTKYVRYILSRKDWKAENLANVMIEKIFTKYDKFITIITDREFLFTSVYWSTFCYYLRVQLRYSIAFHSQTDDQTER